jgi:hypothetical protein
LVFFLNRDLYLLDFPLFPFSLFLHGPFFLLSELLLFFELFFLNCMFFLLADVLALVGEVIDEDV